MQMEINRTVGYLLSKNLREVKKFCAQEFEVLGEMIENLVGDDPEPKPVKPETLSDFYAKCHKHQTSTPYIARSLLMADGIKISTKVIAHISFQLTVKIRKLLLLEKEKKYPLGDRQTHQRSLGESSYGKVRYIGGYCLAKLRYKYSQEQFSHCYKTSPEAQKKYQQACIKTQVLDSMRVSEKVLESSTKHPETLLETSQRQNISRGLTNISDELFSFFLLVCENCLKELVDKNLNVYGSDIYNHCAEKLISSQNIYSVFYRVASVSNIQEFQSESSVSDIMSDMLDHVCSTEEVFQEITKKFLLVMLNQFRKDFLQTLSVEKKMAHRKQIQLKSKDSKQSLGKIDYNFIFEDNSVGKSVSGHIIKGLLMKDKKYLMNFKKTELLSLCKAYNVPAKNSDNKDTLVKKLNSAIEVSDSAIPNTSGLQQAEKPQTGSTLEKEIEYDVAGPSVDISEPQTAGTLEKGIEYDVAGPSVHISEVTSSDFSQPATDLAVPMDVADSSAELCSVCNKEEKEGEQWIQCESCSGWMHRKCAGLSNNFKWRRFSKKNVNFYCQNCK